MRPAVCYICEKCSPEEWGEQKGDWVEFQDYCEKQTHGLSHPHGLEYFCSEHLPAAEQLMKINSDVALKELKRLYHQAQPMENIINAKRYMNIKDIAALIIIDQQRGIANPKLGARNNKNAELEMLKLLSQWRSLDWPVYHIKHRSTQIESVFWPDQDGFEFKPEFLPVANEVVIEKKTPCSFSGTNLELLLDEQGIGSVVVVGASTNNSVEATVRAGGCKGFSMIVVENACFAFEKTDYFGVKRTAEEVHAMSLANLENEYSSIVHSSEVIL